MYREFVEEKLESEYNSPLQATVASTLLGSPEFVRKISERYLSEEQDERNIPAARELVQRPSVDEILQKVKANLAGEKLLRNIAIYCCQKYSGAKLKVIGERFGISDSAVSQASRRLALKAEIDPQLKELIQRVESALGFVKC
jgi:putative transposase